MIIVLLDFIIKINNNTFNKITLTNKSNYFTLIFINNKNNILN